MMKNAISVTPAYKAQLRKREGPALGGLEGAPLSLGVG
jgi:hypothetical protein